MIGFFVKTLYSSSNYMLCKFFLLYIIFWWLRAIFEFWGVYVYHHLAPFLRNLTICSYSLPPTYLHSILKVKVNLNEWFSKKLITKDLQNLKGNSKHDYILNMKLNLSQFLQQLSNLFDMYKKISNCVYRLCCCTLT